MHLDPAEYTVFPHVAVVDEFRMTDPSGGYVVSVDERFLDKLVARMSDRELRTGDLCPVIIGHTIEDGRTEVDQPQIVGYLRQWVKDDFFQTGKKAAFADVWIKNTNKLLVNGEEVVLTAQEVAERWPRRSGEVWPDRYEIDPLSLLGATTPARDLGLMKLSRNGSFTYFSPGDMPVPDALQSPAVTDAAAGQLPILQEILGLLKQLAAKESAPEPEVPAAGPEGGEPQELTDEELEQLLGGEGGEPEPDEDEEESRAGKESVPNAGGYAGGSNTYVPNMVKTKLSRQDQEIATLRTQLAQMQLERSLQEIRDTGIDVDPKDAALIADLAAQPPEMRNRTLDRIKKMSRKAPVTDSFNLESAVAHSTDGTKNRVQSDADRKRVIQLARQKGVRYEDAARELGFDL